jgi:SWI/SNF related-matrix-associated actin-dependent regulator of chromatin subfamily C
MANKPWQIDETVKLLDLIELSGGNWDEIVKNMGSRSREEIILHFLQLPLKNISNFIFSSDSET